MRLQRDAGAKFVILIFLNLYHEHPTAIHHAVAELAILCVWFGGGRTLKNAVFRIRSKKYYVLIVEGLAL